MVSLMHEDSMLEEMDGYVYVDMGMSNSVCASGRPCPTATRT